MTPELIGNKRSNFNFQLIKNRKTIKRVFSFIQIKKKINLNYLIVIENDRRTPIKLKDKL